MSKTARILEVNWKGVLFTSPSSENCSFVIRHNGDRTQGDQPPKVERLELHHLHARPPPGDRRIGTPGRVDMIVRRDAA